MHDSPILILLAGGKSQRMGTPKGLLDYHSTYWILEQISRYKHIDNPKVYIGLGYDFQEYFKTIPWLEQALNSFYKYNGVEVKVILNKKPEYGTFSTLQAVLKTVNINASVIIQPIDVPLVDKHSLKVILNEDNLIVIPTCDGKNGHPVQLKLEFWNRLLTVDVTSNDARLDRQIKQFNSLSITYIKVIDSSIYQNINTKEDWILYKKSST